MNENIQEIEGKEQNESVFNDFNDEISSEERIRKIRLANLRPIKKGQVLNPLGRKPKTEIEKVIDAKVKIAIRKADKLMKLQSPGATRRVVSIAKGRTIGEYAPEHMRTVLAANETILDRAGIVAPKENKNIVAVQVNFKDKENDKYE